MKKFLQRVVVFLLILGVMSALAVAAVIHLNVRALAACTLPPGTDTIIVGDSHPKSAINDAEIPGLRNIALNAEGYKYTHAKLKYVLPRAPQLKKLYIGFSFHNLSGYYDEYIYGATFKFYVERYLGILGLDDYLLVAKTAPLAIPGLIQRIIQRGLPAGRSGECQLFGTFDRDPMTETFRRASMEQRLAAQYYVDGPLTPPSQANIAALEQVLALAREHELEVIMLNTPLHPEYREAVPESYRELYERFLRERDLRAFDFHDLELSDAHFLPDGDHINYPGAQLTTRRFKEFHEAP